MYECKRIDQALKLTMEDNFGVWITLSKFIDVWKVSGSLNGYFKHFPGLFFSSAIQEHLKPSRK